MLMGSCAGMVVALAVVAGTAAEYQNSGSVPSSSASIAFIFIFGVIFAIGFTPMQPIYPAEVLASKYTVDVSVIDEARTHSLTNFRRHASQRHDALPNNSWLC